MQLTMRSTLALLLLTAVASAQDGATTSTRRRPAHSTPLRSASIANRCASAGGLSSARCPQ